MAQPEDKSPPEKPEAAPGRPSRAVPAALFVAALWGAIAPYAGKELGLIVGVRPIVEVVDHVVPGLVALPVALFAIFTGRPPFIGSLAAVLAGFWMTATHVGLIVQGLDGVLVTMPTALWHSVPGMTVLVLAAIMAVAAYKQTPDGAASTQPEDKTAP